MKNLQRILVHTAMHMYDWKIDKEITIMALEDDGGSVTLKSFCHWKSMLVETDHWGPLFSLYKVFNNLFTCMLMWIAYKFIYFGCLDSTE